MFEAVPHPSRIAGHLVIAHPNLGEPAFRHSVLSLPDHDSNGSFGLILNRPTGKTVGQLVTAKKVNHLAAVPVLQGGPVSTDELLFAAFRWHSEKRHLECRHHISMEEAEQLSVSPQHTVRAFVGYAGWRAGQFEAELAHSSWLIRRAEHPEVLEMDKAPVIWRDLASRFGPWFQVLAQAPDNPTLN